MSTRATIPSHRIQPPHTSPRKSRAAPIAAKTGANDGPGMWIPAGVGCASLVLPRRAFGCRRNFRNIQMIQTTTIAKMASGMSAISAPQSGMTRSEVTSRTHSQMASSTAGLG